MDSCLNQLNDYNYIWHLDGADRLASPALQLEPDDVLKEHNNTVEWLNQCLPTLRGNVVVISHHPPSFKSIEPDYVNNETLGAYASNLENLIKKHDIDIWIHGHVHGSQSYNLHNTHVVCNPRGYDPDGLNPNFTPEKALDLRDYETII